MASVGLYESGERVGFLDPETGETAYRGDDGAVELFLGEIDGGLTEVLPGEGAEHGGGTRTITGAELRDHAVGVLEGLGVECRLEDA